MKKAAKTDHKKRNSDRAGAGWTRRTCRFTRDGAKDVDYKDVQTLKALVTPAGKIIPARNTGTKAFFQRRLSAAIKKARYLALLPYCDRHR